MTAVAVIPVSEKNHAAARHMFAGRPLIACALEQARNSRGIARTVVAGGNADTAAIARSWGAETVAVPPGLAPVEGVCALANLRPWLANIEPLLAPDDTIVVLDVGYPVRPAAMIDAAIHRFGDAGAAVLFSAHAQPDGQWRRVGNGWAPVDGQSVGDGVIEISSLIVTRLDGIERAPGDRNGWAVPYVIPEIYGRRADGGDGWTLTEHLYRQLLRDQLHEALAGARLLALDFDGVMTDNRVVVMEDGREAVICNRGDGMGLEMLRKSGFPVAVISKEANPVVSARCRKLKIPCEQGIEDKLPILERVARAHDIGLDAVAFVGNDINDLECLRAAGVAVVPSDAHPAALKEATVVTVAAGGFGAVREVADALIGAPPPIR